jgi:hypothetical protein
MQSVLAEQHTQTLPPLILHPFADASGPGKLVESSRASLMLQGLLPTGEFTAEQLEARLLDGRYCEIRMLFYVGRDLIRWIDQCLELSEREASGYTFQSFVSLLVSQTPPLVQAKLRKWGVADYRSIFSRAIALNSMFSDVPGRQTLSIDFTRNYYRFTDQIFKMLMEGTYKEIEAGKFHFDLYASGEYSRMLEEQWGEPSVRED